jgi:hypothetical protein
MLNVVNAECIKYAVYAECRYAQCCYAECRGALECSWGAFMRAGMRETDKASRSCNLGPPGPNVIRLFTAVIYEFSY